MELDRFDKQILEILRTNRASICVGRQHATKSRAFPAKTGCRLRSQTSIRRISSLGDSISAAHHRAAPAFSDPELKISSCDFRARSKSESTVSHWGAGHPNTPHAFRKDGRSRRGQKPLPVG